MSLQDKYSKLIDFARRSGVKNLNISEQNNVLRVSGSATASVKNEIWSLYDQIDPGMRSGDMVLNITEVEGGGGQEIYEVKSGDNLSKIAAKYPGMTWQKIFEANKDTIKNPDLIRPGQKIIIPV